MVWLVQQQLYPDRKAKNLVGAQSTGLHVSAGPQSTLNAERVGYDAIGGIPQQRTDELASKSDIKQAKRKGFPVPRSFVGAANRRCGPDIVGQGRGGGVGWGGFLASDDPIKKIPHRCAHLLGFQLVPDAVKLTTKISHHTS